MRHTKGSRHFHTDNDNNDNDLDDPGDDLVWDETFASTSISLNDDHDDQIDDSWDPAGNLVDDKTFRYVYDAWNRLVKVAFSADSGAVTVQTAEFDP